MPWATPCAPAVGCDLRTPWPHRPTVAPPEGCPRAPAAVGKSHPGRSSPDNGRRILGAPPKRVKDIWVDETAAGIHPWPAVAWFRYQLFIARHCNGCCYRNRSSPVPRRRAQRAEGILGPLWHRRYPSGRRRGHGGVQPAPRRRRTTDRRAPGVGRIRRAAQLLGERHASGSRVPRRCRKVALPSFHCPPLWDRARDRGGPGGDAPGSRAGDSRSTAGDLESRLLEHAAVVLPGRAHPGARRHTMKALVLVGE
jgi:hypothetical protein